jgi:starch synthase (maltosyl-transferring)
MVSTRAGDRRQLPPSLTAVKGRARVVIDAVRPQVDGGRFPAKREVGDLVEVEADVFADGHDELACELRWRHVDGGGWSSTAMSPLGNDRWRGTFEAARTGTYRFCVRGTIDRYGTWVRNTLAKLGAGQDVTVELLVGAELLDEVAGRAKGRDRAGFLAAAEELRAAAASGDVADALAAAATPERRTLVRRYPEAESVVASEAYPILVERRRARYGAWYELFPRSASPKPGRHGTFADVEARLPYVAGLGFDVLYLPPVHPVGRVNRKGRDGAPVAADDDPGSPWAIGAEEGGHTAVHPELGTLEDFDHLVEAAGRHGLELALDLAFQCAPDHPWVKEHPEWFRHLPDGTIRYAENPPKRYEDIYPLDFDTADWQALWAELLEVVRFWIGHGIRIFRVDNPHTKPLRFWEWLIAEVHAGHPDVVFLSEAFTRPAVMYRLAKIGFSQSYTYFAWRNAKWELEQYLHELHGTEVADFFRPNLWPNTPDILTELLQRGGRPAFMSRLVLAATMAASYGIYGPPFELQEHVARHEGSEEYLHSEKYQVRHWDLEARQSLAAFVTRVNEIRRESPALQVDRNLHFHRVDNDALVAYSRVLGTNRMLMVVNLDPYYRQAGWLELDMDALGLAWDTRYAVHDLLTGARYDWSGNRPFVQLDPAVVPAHVLRVEQVGSP